MYPFSRLAFWAAFLKEFRCRHCGGREGYVSLPRNFIERYVLPALYLRPARCGDCYQRSWHLGTVPLLPRPDPMRFDAQEMVASAQAADRKETGKDTPVQPEDRKRIA